MWPNVAKCGLFRLPELNQWTRLEFVDGVRGNIKTHPIFPAVLFLSGRINK
jgi:hypothetical protein